LNKKVAAPVYKTEINGRGKSSRCPRNTLYPQRLALSSPTSGCRSIGVFRLRTKVTEFVVFVFIYVLNSTANGPLQNQHEFEKSKNRKSAKTKNIREMEQIY
jgi:hypothetical protein